MSEWIQSKEGIKEAIRRNKRMGGQKSTFDRVEIKQDETQAYLQWWVFNEMGITPTGLITQLQLQYSAEDNFRQRRQRNIEYVRGRHFNETVYDPDAKRYMTQFEYLKRRNIEPLTYNVTSKLVRSLTGQFREMDSGNIVKCDSKEDRGTELATILTSCIDRIKNKEKAKDKDAMNVQEMFISGRPVFKVFWGSKNNITKTDARFRIVATDKFSINPGVTDYDLDNYHTSLEIHDVTLNDIIMNFANGDYERGMQIKKAYEVHAGAQYTKASYSSQSYDGSESRNRSFHTQGIGNSAYRYLEVWTLISSYEAITEDPLAFNEPMRKVHKWMNPEKVKKQVDEVNRVRLENSEGEVPEEEILIRFKADFVSRNFVIYMTPWGMVLDVRESPYKSGLSPYIFTPPAMNGEQWGIVEEVLNAQRGLDKQIQNADQVNENASKGVWLVPDTAIPDTHSNKQYLQELKRADGAVIYKVRDGMENIVPQQFYANSANVSAGIQTLIGMYSNLMDEISGNYAAAQGKQSGNKTASGYALESNNAGLNVRHIIEMYFSLQGRRDELLLQFILEGYTKEDYLRITGTEIDPAELEEYEFTIEQSKGTNSPAYRMESEMRLLQQVMSNLLPYKVFLEVSTDPIMVQTKQKLDEYEKKMAEQQQQAMMQNGGVMPQQAMQQQPQMM